VNYDDFISTKLVRAPASGIDAPIESEHLFDFQRDLVRWALRRGRAAIFADTGLGKTRMELTWCDAASSHTGLPSLIFAPLAVAQQTADEGAAIGIDVTVCRDQSNVRHGVNVINYDRRHLIDASAFGAVACDESSILKHHTSKTLAEMIESFGQTPYKLCCTATPSPNDYMELGTHAEFLGICTRAEMLAEFFVHDGGETQKWRLKGHARGAFWRFVASWGALIRSPEDLGYDGSAYILPPITVEHHTIEASADSVRDSGLLFAMPATSLMERRAARRGSMADRVHECAELVNATDDAWVVWCDLNDESAALTKLIRGAVEVTGAMTTEEKEAGLERFRTGEARVIVSKPSICGFGLNWQHCHRMAFVGVTDSWEAFHQAKRRIHRFGQKRACDVHVFASQLEGAVVQNLARKERDALAMSEELSREAAESVRESVLGSKRVTNTYNANVRMTVPAWLHSEVA
jgi:hypothetical protein